MWLPPLLCSGCTSRGLGRGPWGRSTLTTTGLLHVLLGLIRGPGRTARSSRLRGVLCTLGVMCVDWAGLLSPQLMLCVHPRSHLASTLASNCTTMWPWCAVRGTVVCGMRTLGFLCGPWGLHTSTYSHTVLSGFTVLALPCPPLLTAPLPSPPPLPQPPTLPPGFVACCLPPCVVLFRAHTMGLCSIHSPFICCIALLCPSTNPCFDSWCLLFVLDGTGPHSPL